jgi:hypothetical protein
MNFLFTVRQNGCSIPVYASRQAGETATSVLLSAALIAPNLLRICAHSCDNNRADCKECQYVHNYSPTNSLESLHNA